MNKLSDIASLQTGYSFRSKIAFANDGDLHVIQMRDVDFSKERINEGVARIAKDGLSEKYYLKPGDLLFAAKGFRNMAFLVGQIPMPTIATSVFVVVKVKTKELMPEYVQVVLNHDFGQRQLATLQQQSSSSNIRLQDLGNMEIPVLPLTGQERIVNIYRLRQKEKTLTNKLLELRKIQTNSYIQQMLNNNP